MRLNDALDLAAHLASVHNERVWGVMNGMGLLKERKLPVPAWQPAATGWLVLVFEDHGKSLIGFDCDMPLIDLCIPLVNVNDTQMVGGSLEKPRLLNDAQVLEPCTCANWRAVAA